MPRKRPLPAAPPALPETHTSPLQSLSAMPVVLQYKAVLQTVAATVENGETIFRWRSMNSAHAQALAKFAAENNGNPPTREQVEAYQQIESDQPYTTPLVQPIDPRALTNEFLAVRTEREALNFLRHNGAFFPIPAPQPRGLSFPLQSWNDRVVRNTLQSSDDSSSPRAAEPTSLLNSATSIAAQWVWHPSNDNTPTQAVHSKADQPGLAEISWSEFQLWQRFAGLVRERSPLAKVHEAMLDRAEETLAALDPNGSLRLAVRDLFVDSSCFPDADYTSFFWKQEPAFARTENGDHIYAAHRRLQQWFAKPPADACSILHIPRSADSSGYTAHPAALACLANPAEMVPVLRIHAECSLQAIAATLYAERIAGVVIERCRGCDSLFEAHGLKTFCSTICGNRVRTQECRKAKKLKAAAALPKRPAARTAKSPPHRRKA